MTEQFIIRLRRSLSEPLPLPLWPEGIRLIAFDPDRHAKDFHALLEAAYARGGGSVEAFPVWWTGLKEDAEYDPDLCLVAVDGRDELVGVMQCWTSGYIKDVAVKSEYRGKGLGSALLLHAFRMFQERGAAFVDLKVEADNPSGALRLYRSHGMREVEAEKAT